MSSHDDDNDRSPELPKDERTAELSALKDRGWITLRDFAVIADVTYVTVLRWVKLEMIRPKMNGGVKRIYQDELARYLRDGTLPPNPEKLAEEKTKREEYKQNAEASRKHRNSPEYRKGFRPPVRRA